MQKITTDDQAIIERFQSGKRDAFDELVQRHRRRAFHYAIHLTKNPEEANDIVDEAFIRVFRSLMNFRGDSSFPTWLYRIVTNCYLDSRKKARNHREVSFEDAVYAGGEPIGPHLTYDQPTPHEHVERKERISLMESALNLLPKNTQTILLMYHADSMSYDEIAGSLRLPIGTVKSRLNRARLRLRRALQPWSSVFTS
jgi:RNA polymerase sigma-70 factor (ECF subfamily)